MVMFILFFTCGGAITSLEISVITNVANFIFNLFLKVSILKKTRHTNLALFMGACLTQPNVAIITR